MLRNSAQRYGLVTKALHWWTAVLIFVLIGLGWYMVDLTYFDRWYNAALSWHKALGLLVLALGSLMLCWKVFPRLPTIRLASDDPSERRQRPCIIFCCSCCC